MTILNTAEPAGATERHASWTELFFDLVVVAGVLQLSHLLHEGPKAPELALYVLLYLAFWIAWVCFTMYGNVEGNRAWTPGLLLAMLGLGIMVAAVPGIRTRHSLAFVTAYVFLRWLSSRFWRRGQVVMDWPVAQMGLGVLPWIVSLWVDTPWRYWLWALGIGFDLVVILTDAGARMLQGAQEWAERIVRKHGDRGRMPVIEAAYADVPHLMERLGLYVIIVLGEGVAQITSTAADTPWDPHLASAAAGSFVLLCGLWCMSLLYGFGGIPKTGPRDLPVRLTLTLHCVTTCALASVAAGLGLAIAHPHDPAVDGVRWLLCAGLMVYFGISVLAAAISGARWRGILGWALPCLLLPLALGVFAQHLGAGWLIWALAAAVGWQLLFAPEERGGLLARLSA